MHRLMRALDQLQHYGPSGSCIELIDTSSLLEYIYHGLPMASRSTSRFHLGTIDNSREPAIGKLESGGEACRPISVPSRSRTFTLHARLQETAHGRTCVSKLIGRMI